MLAYKSLNTRYYAGRMVQCEFVNIPNWSSAICGKEFIIFLNNFLFLKKGLSERGKCPKGRRCNYLHVFRNPSNKKLKHSNKEKISHH